MSNKNMILGIYEHPDAVLNAVKEIRGRGLDVIDVYAPFPIHGMEKAMGLKRTRLTVLAFCFAMCGLLFAFWLQNYTINWDWPMNIGGKPNVPYALSFVPVCFELMILCTAFGMTLSFFMRANMWHGIREDIYDIRQTDDRFVLAIDADAHGINKEEVSKLLIEKGAVEIRERKVA